MNTTRYQKTEHLIKKKLEFSANIGQRGSTIQHLSHICLQHIHVDGIKIDHVWVKDTLNLGEKHKQGTRIKFIGKLTTRKRAPDSIFDDPKLDIRIKIIEILD